MSDAPEWLAELKRRCAPKGAQARVAEQLRHGSPKGFPSASTLNQVLKGKYKGDTKRLQALVEGMFLGQTVECPVLGELARNRCMEEQKRPFAATNALRVQLFHACKTCPNRRELS